MTQAEAIKKMNNGTLVQITPAFRKFWGRENLGRWFYIQKVGTEDVTIISESTHQMYLNADLSNIK